MAKQKLKKPRKSQFVTKKRRIERHGVDSLLAAALTLPGVNGTPVAHAQTPPRTPTVEVQFSTYDEWQGSGEDRMRIRAPMVYFNGPAGERGEVEGSWVFDSMSGASVLYLDSRTGASELGVEDQRSATDWTYRHYFDRLSIGGTLYASIEDDFTSRGAGFDTRWWTEDKNTVVSVGVSANDDDIWSTNNRELDESRRTLSQSVGVTQTLSPNALMQSNVQFSSAAGYLSDQYKTFDNRPRSRDEIAWLTRIIHYIEATDGSLHLDYRLYDNSWGISSHTIETAWYQPLGTVWMLRPRFRYYSQSAAEFWGTDFTPEVLFGEQHFSADTRVGAFGSFTAGSRLTYEASEALSWFFGLDFYQQQSRFRVGGSGSEQIPRLSAVIGSTGLRLTF